MLTSLEGVNAIPYSPTVSADKLDKDVPVNTGYATGLESLSVDNPVEI